MSVKVMTWVWEHGPQCGTERMLLLALADHCDDAGHAYPSMAGLAAKACVTERGARLIMRRLESAGWVNTQIGGGRGGKSRYHILMVNPEQQTGNDKPGIVNPEPDGAKPGTWTHKTRNPGSPEPSVTIIEPSKVAPPAARVLRFDEFWNAYPHRDGVKRARAKVEAKYRAAVKSGVPEQSLVDAATRFRSDKRVRDGFACDPLTWFGRRGWEDEPAANPIVAGKPLPNFEQAIDNLERGIRAGRWPRADLLTAAHVEALITRRVLTREEAARRGFPLAAAPIRKETA